MKKGLLFLLATLACSSFAVQSAELGLSNFKVEYPRNPLYEGDTLRFVVTVTNNGEANASGYVGQFIWGTIANWSGEMVPAAAAISLGWGEGLAPGQSLEVTTYLLAQFGQEGKPYAALYADEDVSNDTIYADVTLEPTVRAYANELVLSDLALSDNGDPYMLYEGNTIAASAALTNRGREAQKGTAHLLLDGVEVDTYDYNLEPETADSLSFSFAPKAGSYKLSVAVEKDENAVNDTVSSDIVVFIPGRLNESFENLVYNSSTYSYAMPEGWDGTFSFSSYGAPHGAMYAATYNKDGYLATPKLSTSASDSLSFLTRVTNPDITVCVYASKDFQTWTLVKEAAFTAEQAGYTAPYQTVKVYFNENENSEFANSKIYLKFGVGGTVAYPSVNLDCIQGPAPLEVTEDLEVVSVSAESYFEAGVEGNIYITIANNGKNAYSSNVTLKVGEEQIAVLPTGEIASGETVTLVQTYVPTEANPALACTATLNPDDADANNSLSANLQVYPLGGLTLPFTQFFDEYTNVSEVPYWSFGSGWSIWYVYGAERLDENRGKCIAFSKSTEESALAVSPLLNLENENITVSFWLRRDDNSWHVDKTDHITAYVNGTPDLEGATQLVSVCRSYTQDPAVEAAGWYQYTFTLTEGNHPAKGFLVFEGVGAEGSYGYFDLDAIEVAGKNAKDLTVTAVTPAEGAVLAGREVAAFVVQAEVANVGTENISGATFNWSVDGEAQTPVTVNLTIAPEASEIVDLGEFKFPTAANHIIEVTVVNEEDKIASNNTCKANVSVEEASTIPYANDLETEEAFAEFLNVDADGNGVSWVLENGAANDVSYNAETGDGYNQDDWLITPALYIPAEDATLSFSAIEPEGGKDSYEVLVAETLRDTEIFKSIYSKTITASEEVELPLAAYAGKTIYIAFRHVSVADDTEAVGFAIDNVMVNGSTTGIHTLEAAAAGSRIFDLMGRQVKNAGKGVFVIDGRKVVK